PRVRRRVRPRPGLPLRTAGTTRAHRRALCRSMILLPSPWVACAHGDEAEAWPDGRDAAAESTGGAGDEAEAWPDASRAPAGRVSRSAASEPSWCRDAAAESTDVDGRPGPVRRARDVVHVGAVLGRVAHDPQ